MDYFERLRVPVLWWVLGTLLVATFWLALAVAIPEALAWAITAAAMLLLAGGLFSFGARVSVKDNVLRAGKAHIGLNHVGSVEPLDQIGTKRAAGVDADARAYLLLRPYLKRAVKVEITDPADPAPYWLISTRHPEELTTALGWTSDSSTPDTVTR